MPEFTVYKCQWADCHAEVHNYEVLRYHVLYVHHKEMSQTVFVQFPCKWKDCCKPATNAAEEQTLLNNFHDAQEWEAHVSEHIVEINPVHGLGPDCGFSGPEPFISGVDVCHDAKWKQITTSITLAPPGYTWIPPPGFNPDEHFNMVHGINIKRSASTTTQSRMSYDQAFKAKYARAIIMGAGMETYEADDLLQDDDGTGLSRKDVNFFKACVPNSLD
ncbi:hypothetical protein RUND412_008643 [Rhizina undulata]